MTRKSGIVQFSALQPLIYRFHVEIIGGPVTDAFVRRNPEPPSRVIELRGTDTLEALHWAIFRAFDREDAHCYQFELGGKKPMDRKASVYSIEACCDDPRAHDATTTRVDALPLREGQTMLYWFDFGDDWWHSVTLLAKEQPPAKKIKYPRVVERKGESPPQYADWDEADEDAGLDTAKMAEQAERFLAAALQVRKEHVQSLVTDFCRTKLDAEYTRVCLLLLEKAWLTGMMHDRSKEKSWAAGLVQAAAVINFLYDTASQPCVRATDVAKHFGVATSTMSSKGNAILDALGAVPLDPRYCIAPLLKNNPFVQMMELGLFGTGPNRKL